MKLTVTHYDRYEGQRFAPSVLDPKEHGEYDADQPDHDILEDLFRDGFVWHGSRVVVERNGYVREYRCDGSGWSMVIDPTIFGMYVHHATGKGHVERFWSVGAYA